MKAGGHFIDDETLIYDNSETKPNLILQIADKKVIKIAERIPKWCNQLCDELVELGFKTT